MSSLKKEITEEDMAQFDWLTLQKDMDSVVPTESQREKFFRKFRENPFVPIGCLATTAALCYGLYSFKTGKKKMSQYMMRTRIAAQGFTIFAMVFGVAMGASKIAGKDKRT